MLFAQGCFWSFCFATWGTLNASSYIVKTTIKISHTRYTVFTHAWLYPFDIFIFFKKQSDVQMWPQLCLCRQCCFTEPYQDLTFPFAGKVVTFEKVLFQWQPQPLTSAFFPFLQQQIITVFTQCTAKQQVWFNTFSDST